MWRPWFCRCSGCHMEPVKCPWEGMDRHPAFEGHARIFMTQRILIIDDEDDIREVAAMSLETVAGWEVMVANSGAQGLTRAAMYKPDAILLDVMMPGMDGPTTFRELRKNPATAKIPVLFLTAK